MTSKFFQKQEVSSESENESEISQEQEIKQVKAAKKQQYFDSSSEDEEKRKVRSEKDKRFEEIQNASLGVIDKIEEKDFVGVMEKFEAMNKGLEKAKKVIEKEGIPNFYIEALIEIINLVNDNEIKQNIKSKSQNKSFNILKQKMPKFEAQYLADITRVKRLKEEEINQEQNPQELNNQDQNKQLEKGWYEKSQTNTPSVLSESEDQDDSDDSDIDSVVSENDPSIRRLRWLKPEFHPNYKKNLAQKKSSTEDVIDTKQKHRNEMSEKIYENVGWQEKQIKIDQNISEKGIYEEIKKVIDERLNNNQNYFQHQELLRQYLLKAFNDKQKLEILLILLPVRYDYSRIVSQSLMTRNLWLQIYENNQQMFNLLKTGELDKVLSFNETEPFYFKENLNSILVNQLTQLNSEIQKYFKITDVVSEEYILRLQDLQKYLVLLNEANKILEGKNYVQIAYLRIENLYHVSDDQVETIYKQSISNLFENVYQNLTDHKSKIKTILYYIYNNALHDRFYQAKDLLQLLQPQVDIQIEVLFNRTISQLGLSAFRLGLIQECQALLQDICHLMKAKENLCQIITKNLNEKLERQRFVPLYQHINSDQVEAAFMISSMLYDLPNICQEKQSSKFFKKMLDTYDRNYFITYENSKDFVFQASQELERGNWESCYDQLLQINIWNSFANKEVVIERIKNKIKESALICYLIKFKNCLDILSMDKLINQFQLSHKQIRVIICQLFQNQLQGYFDQDDNICIENNQTSKLQEITQELQEKIDTFILHNERIMDAKYGIYGFGDKGDKEIIEQNKKILKKKQVFVQSKQLRQKKK